MPAYLDDTFVRINAAIDHVRDHSLLLASQFTTDTPRDRVVQVHTYLKGVIAQAIVARDRTGMEEECRKQWDKPTLDWVATIQGIIDAAQACVDFLEENYPTVRSTLNAAMDALAVPAGQQDAVRAQMGANLDYLLVQRVSDGAVETPTIPAALLAPLVTLLNALAAAATI